ncbi:hypothetical protein Tco_0683096 [Tanacetum coccineum]|uniref:Uncharacterized protein n=1 Tax=Tanacetum coccineum TaxID=301880 RepID=A0ABQ4XTM0_9ASTR
MHQDSPLLRVNTLGSDEGSMTQHELIAFCTTLSKKVESLETDLKQTKLIYGAAYTRLIKKVKKKIAEIDQDPGISLVQHTAGVAVTTASVVVSTVSPTRNTIVSTADDITMAKIMVYIKKSAVKDKAELKEERRQRIARVHEPASSFNVEEWEDIQFIVEVDEEAYQPEKEIKTLFETTMSKVDTFVPIESEVDRAVPKLAARSAKRAAEEELDQESSKRQKTGESSELAKKPRDKEADELDDLVMLWSLVKEKFNSTEPTNDKEKEIWVELKRLFKPDIDDELWKLQKKIHDLTWRLCDSCRVHHVYTDEGMDIYMLVEKEYPLSRGTLTLMLVAKLLVDQDNEMSRELLRKIFMQVERLRR